MIVRTILLYQKNKLNHTKWTYKYTHTTTITDFNRRKLHIFFLHFFFLVVSIHHFLAFFWFLPLLPLVQPILFEVKVFFFNYLVYENKFKGVLHIVLCVSFLIITFNVKLFILSIFKKLRKLQTSIEVKINNFEFNVEKPTLKKNIEYFTYFR